MSSVSFNIGFSNERNSSRVLKPPGGGHTDIFGIGDVPEPKKPQKTNEAPVVETETKTETEPTIEEESQKGPEEEVAASKPSEEIIENKNNVAKEEPKLEPPRRTRVPPGGYSSGLW